MNKAAKTVNHNRINAKDRKKQILRVPGEELRRISKTVKNTRGR
jgi:hypothetical protein